jgi:hypothetical protein
MIEFLIAIEFIGNHHYHQLLSGNKVKAMVKMQFHQQDMTDS